MFIQTESTPNPETLKFLPGRTVLADDTREYLSRAAAEESPDFGASGVKKKNGMAQLANRAADIRATTLSGSCSDRSSPNRGACGNHDQFAVDGRPGNAKAQQVKPSANTLNPLPSDRASPDALCAVENPAARIKRELWNTSE